MEPTRTDNEKIPIIDIAPFFAGGAGGRRVVEQVNAACEDHGFLIITGHGVPADTIDRMYRTSRAFFDLPPERKLASAPPAPDVFRGYIGMAVTGLSYSMGKPTPPDLREVYISGTVEEMPADYVRGLDAGNRLPPNIWPEGLPGFRAASEEYQRAMAALARRLLTIFAAALDLPQGFFDAKVDKSNSFILTANYPALLEPPLPGQLRAGAHTDFGVVTIVYQDDAPGGLEVQGRDGGWIDVKPVPGSLVVNLGDIMAQWTNDVWVSSTHRVVPPPPALAASSRRQSMTYFFHPNYDAVIECMPSCAGPARSSRYPPTIAHEFMFGKTSRSITMALT